MNRLLAILACSLFAAAAPAATFQDFSGACQGGAPESPYWNHLVGWNRFDITWSSAEPEEGKYNETYLKKMYGKMRQNIEHGIKVLPVLAYAPGWASIRGEYVFEQGNERKVYTPAGENDYRLKEFRKSKEGVWELQAGKDGKTEKTVKNPRIPLAPENIAKWQAFVRRVVSDLRQPPYNVEYFQIWNEAHPKSGFYNGALDEYVRNIHLPAAEEIRKLGGKVVYGGFPSCGTVDKLAAVLTECKAWDSLDVIDIHYLPEWCMEYLRKKAAENGRPDMGVWQTEIIFHRKYYAVGQIYPTVLYWGLTHGWNDPDRYKLMIFAFGSPDDPKAYGYAKCMTAGRALTPHGKALETLAGIFGKEEIEPYSHVKSEPQLEFAIKGNRIAAFRTGNRILVAAIFDGKTLAEQEKQNLETLRLSLPEINPDSVKSVARVGVFGERQDIYRSCKPADGGIEVEVPLREDPENRYADKFFQEDSLRRPVVYTLIELK